MFGALFSKPFQPWSTEKVRNPVQSYIDAISLFREMHLDNLDKPRIHRIYQEGADSLDTVLRTKPQLKTDRSLHQGYSNIMMQYILDERMDRPNQLLSFDSKAFARQLRENPVQIPSPAREILAYLAWFASVSLLMMKDPGGVGDLYNLEQTQASLELSLRFNDDNAAANSDLAYVLGSILEIRGPDTETISQALKRCDRAIQLWPTNASAYRAMSVIYILKGDKAMALETFTKAKALEPKNLQNAALIESKIRSMG